MSEELHLIIQVIWSLGFGATGIAYVLRKDATLKVPFLMQVICAIIWPVVLIGIALAFGLAIHDGYEEVKKQ